MAHGRRPGTGFAVSASGRPRARGPLHPLPRVTPRVSGPSPLLEVCVRQLPIGTVLAAGVRRPRVGGMASQVPSVGPARTLALRGRGPAALRAISLGGPRLLLRRALTALSGAPRAVWSGRLPTLLRLVASRVSTHRLSPSWSTGGRCVRWTPAGPPTMASCTAHPLGVRLRALTLAHRYTWGSRGLSSASSIPQTLTSLLPLLGGTPPKVRSGIPLLLPRGA